MFKTLVLFLCTVACHAVPLSYDDILSDATLGSTGYGIGGGYDNGLALADSGAWHGAHVDAAIQSHRSIQIIPVPSNEGHAEPMVIEIGMSEQPVIMNFKSRSSPLLANQNHHGQPGSHQDTHSIDEPHVLRHEVTRPVVQEIREVIVPQRNVLQEIRPVIENVQTLVAKGEGKTQTLGGVIGGGELLTGKIDLGGEIKGGAILTQGALGLGGAYGEIKSS